MEGFKSTKKITCFKEGGQVKYESRKQHKAEVSADIAQDKKIVKKAIAMHDKQEHKGEKTDLSKLKKGGRAKKATGTVKKYKTGGEVTNVYEAKKSSGDKDNIRKTKDIKPKKLAEGSLAGPMGKVAELEQLRQLGRLRRMKQLPPSMQSQAVAQGVGNPAPAGNYPDLAPQAPAPVTSTPMGDATGLMARKRGGKIKKYAEGGSIDDDVRARAMKWIESGSPEQAEAPSAPVAKTVKRAKAAKLPLPDYSNEDLDRMDAEIAEKNRRSKRTPRQMLEEESEYTIKPSLQTKGERLMKSAGLKFKRGGKACK